MIRGNSYQKVADELSMPKSSVATIIRHTKATGYLMPSSRSGRPRKTSPQLDRIIVRTVKANPRMSANAIVAMLKKDHGVNVAPQTVRNRINESGLNGRASRKKPYLSKKHKRIRLQYARAYVSYTVEVWKKVLFSDESSVEKHGTSGQQWVWRPRGCAFDQRYLPPTFKSQRESVMDWGYDTEFLHDGASCHRAKTVKEYLRLKSIKLVKHPAQSPDLNPIENLWAHVKAQLYQRPATTKEEH
ncbi:TPA: hypothetical protein N0F65_008907 [Lagenidium giganteum]|uniref:Transposase n=1 Tax=Lagenidium giganteum TaxID=4803 RepID=A0AAV2YXJ0_9STRA|nr:TPA: hypothetical protein N0F65_008907 [Lagenidium giganteum]